jgi:D-3-phosphoglycerate dehydrogenase / 2-oxoglutarate reductase
MTTPGANSNAVAEEVVALMLAEARHVIAADASCRKGEWEKKKFMGREIAGKSVGIVGLGNIGRLLARRLSGFDVKMYGYDPAISADRAAEMNVELTDIESLVSKCDYISLHIPENDETRGMFNEKLLSKVKSGAAIINCARAGIIDEAALRKVKPERKLRFLNDVFAKDEPGPKSVADIADIVLPHLGASTFEANLNAAKRAAEQLVDFDSKGVTSYIVNRDIPEGLDEKFCDLAYTIARLARSLIGKNTPLKLIETSFYGSLEPYANWLLMPIVSALWEEFDRSMDYQAARKRLEERGIDYVNRVTDPGKGFESSITIDFTGEVSAGTLNRASIRGTVAENIMMISRINEFNKLYFEPAGHTLFFIYHDRPGVIGSIGSQLAAEGINIEDMRNPHDLNTNHSLALLKVNKPAGDALMEQIGKSISAISAFSVKL